MNRKVLITGGSRGLGKATAQKFASNHYDVIINYNTSEKEALALKDELINDYKVNVLVIKCDVSNESEVKRMFCKIKDTWGKIDVLINNAGIAIDNNLESKNSEEFLNVIKTNLLGTFLVSKYVLMIMDKGCIVNVSSNCGISPSYIESIDYDASKAGVISMTHNFAREYAPYIRVNGVAPGWINTDMNKGLSPHFKKEEEEKILLSYFAEPEDIANVIYFVSSDAGKYINDTIIRVDGGLK